MPYPVDGYLVHEIYLQFAINSISPGPVNVYGTFNWNGPAVAIADMHNAFEAMAETMKTELEGLYPTGTITVERTYRATKFDILP